MYPGLWVLVVCAVMQPCAGRCGDQDKAQGPGRILRVAYPELEGMSETDENGTRHGIVVDYLNEIAKYTGWQYEYIDTAAEDMIPEFLDGQYDLMAEPITSRNLNSILPIRITIQVTINPCCWPAVMIKALIRMTGKV